MKLPKLSITVYAFLAFAFVLGLSFIAGQCRKYGAPVEPEKIEGKVDAGVPTPGPVAEAPTITDSIPIARPDLTREEIVAKAKEYGMTFVESRKTEVSEPSTASVPQVQEFPYLFAEETFVHDGTGLTVDASAWVDEWGGRVNLRAKWRDYTPPPDKTADAGLQCPSKGFFENKATWEGSVGYGAVAGSEGVGLGPFGSIGYLGPRTGALTWGAGGFGGWSNASGVVAAGGARITF